MKNLNNWKKEKKSYAISEIKHITGNTPMYNKLTRRVEVNIITPDGKNRTPSHRSYDGLLYVVQWCMRNHTPENTSAIKATKGEV